MVNHHLSGQVGGLQTGMAIEAQGERSLGLSLS
jgi:hypothetical protein